MTDGENPELGISITGNADSAQAAVRGVTRDVNDLGDSASSVGKQTDALGGIGTSAFGKLAQGARLGGGEMAGLNQIMKGGVGEITGFARAANDLFKIIAVAGGATGGFALLAVGIGVVVGALSHFITGSKAAKTHLDELATSAEKLGKAWATKELEMFNHELHETNREIDTLEAKMKVLIGIKEKLNAESTKQATLGIQIAEARKAGKLASDIEAIEADKFLPADVKAFKIAALRRANEDDKTNNAAAIKAAEFKGEQADAKLQIKEIDAEKKANDDRALALKINADEKADEVRKKSATFENLTETKKLDTQLAAERRTLFGLESRQKQGLSGAEVGEFQNAIVESKNKIERLEMDRARTGIPNSTTDQLVQKLGEVDGELKKLNVELKEANDKARDAKADAAAKNEVLSTKQAGIPAILAAKGTTAALGVAKDQVDFDTSKIGELAKLLGDVRKNQETLFGLTGDAFNAQQTVTNRSIDIYQSVIKSSHATDKNLQQVQRQMDADRSNIGP